MGLRSIDRVRAAVRPAVDVTRCPLCSGQYLYPVAIDEDAAAPVLLRCGQCDAWTRRVLSRRQVNALWRAVTRDVDGMRRAAARLEAADASSFVAALRRGEITATDFQS
jgi:hypothetical protein